MAIIENRVTEEGDVLIIQPEVPIIGLLSLYNFVDTTDEYQIVEYHLFVKGNTSYNLTEKSRSGSTGLSASAVSVSLGSSLFGIYFSNFDSSAGDNIHSNIVLKGTRSTY